MQKQRFNPSEQTEPAQGGDRSMLVIGLVVVVTAAALIATSFAGMPTAAPSEPVAAGPGIPYFPAPYEMESQAAEPAPPVATF